MLNWLMVVKARCERRKRGLMSVLESIRSLGYGFGLEKF